MDFRFFRAFGAILLRFWHTFHVFSTRNDHFIIARVFHVFRACGGLFFPNNVYITIYFKYVSTPCSLQPSYGDYISDYNSAGIEDNHAKPHIR